MRRVLLALLMLGTLLQSAFADTNEQQAYAAYGAAQRQYINSRWKEAVEQLQTAVRLNPSLLAAWYLLGLSCCQLNQYSQAEDAFTHVVHLDARNYQGWVQLANSQLAQGQYDKARDSINCILRFDPRSFLAEYALGVISYKQGRLQDAVGHFDRSRVIWGEYAPTLYNLGVAQYNQGLVGPALSQLRKASLMEPKKALYEFALGWTQYRSGDKGSAWNTFRRLAEDDKTHTYSSAARALMEMVAGNWTQAAASVEEALRQDAELVKALVIKGLILSHDGKKPEAIAALQEALEIDPLDFDARDTLSHMGVTPPEARPARLPGQRPSPSPIVPAASPSAPAPTPVSPRPELPPPPGVPATHHH